MLSVMVQWLTHNIGPHQLDPRLYEQLESLEERRRRVYMLSLVRNRFLVSVFLAQLRTVIKELELLQQRVTPELFDGDRPRIEDPRVLQIATEFFSLSAQHRELLETTKPQMEQFFQNLKECEEKLEQKAGDQRGLLVDLNRASAGFHINRLFVELVDEGTDQISARQNVQIVLIKLKRCAQLLEQLKVLVG